MRDSYQHLNSLEDALKSIFRLSIYRVYNPHIPNKEGYYYTETRGDGYFINYTMNNKKTREWVYVTENVWDMLQRMIKIAPANLWILERD